MRLIAVVYGRRRIDVGVELNVAEIIIESGDVQADLEGAEHEVTVEGAAEALARMGVVGQGFEADGGQQAWRRRGFDHVVFLVGGTARDEPRAVVEAFELSIFFS